MDVLFNNTIFFLDFLRKKELSHVLSISKENQFICMGKKYNLVIYINHKTK